MTKPPKTATSKQ